jgi:hypothetical protein
MTPGSLLLTQTQSRPLTRCALSHSAHSCAIEPGKEAVFLDQRRNALRLGETTSPEISKSAIKHGHDLPRQGFTVSQVVHDHGDVCQGGCVFTVDLPRLPVPAVAVVQT